MKRLLYISTARSPMAPADLDLLLARARTANAAADVTGLLVVGGRRFLQVLEGPADAVEATYARIIRDDRHFALVKLHDKAITARSFAAWHMGFERGGDGGASGSLEEQVGAIIAPLADADLRAYFAGFARTHSPV